ncbi:hypothetical protein JTM26_35725, partial [Pseudomonas aeruginosa]|nr:hypothetical protein [Pseudomonas aeruginosa]
ARALELNTDNIPAVIAEIKMKVESERASNPNTYMLEYKTARQLSETDVDAILGGLKDVGIFEAFTEGAHTIDINGVHTLMLMFPAKRK